MKVEVFYAWKTLTINYISLSVLATGMGGEVCGIHWNNVPLKYINEQSKLYPESTGTSFSKSKEE